MLPLDIYVGKTRNAVTLDRANSSSSRIVGSLGLLLLHTFCVIMVSVSALCISGCLIECRDMQCPKEAESGQDFVMTFSIVAGGESGGGAGLVMQLPDSVSFQSAWYICSKGRKALKRNTRLEARYSAEKSTRIIALSDSVPASMKGLDSMRVYVRLKASVLGRRIIKWALVEGTPSTGPMQWLKPGTRGPADFKHVVDSMHVRAVEFTSSDKTGFYALHCSGQRQYAVLRGCGDYRLGLDSSFTFEMWMRSTGYDMPLISTRPDDFTTRFPFEMRVDAQGCLVVSASNGSRLFQTHASRTIADGAWHHIAGVFDAARGELAAFVDGSLEGAVKIPSTACSHPRRPVFISASPAKRRFFSGDIDEVRYWSYARTPGQIRTQMTSMLSGFESGLLAWFNFESGEDSILTNGASDSTIAGVPMNRPKLVNSSLPFTSEVLGFLAVLDHDTVKTTWEVFDKKDVESYEVEKRTESGRFETVYRAGVEGGAHQVYRWQQPWNERSVVYYRLRKNTLDGIVVYSDEFPIGAERFHNFLLGDSSPEPFLDQVTIAYHLKESALVSLRVYDQYGRFIDELVGRKQPAGDHVVQFTGEGLPPGAYYYRLRTQKGVQTRGMTRAEE